MQVQVACGQCLGCRLERSRQWAVRIMHEASLHDANSFLTLTYDNRHLPENGSLVKRDWQLFAKRARKAFGPFRFYHCGEYGDLHRRPHYHACMFGVNFSGDRVFYKQHRGNPLYISPRLSAEWGKGFAVIGELTFESAAYVARYCMKKRTGVHEADEYEVICPETGEVVDWREPEYATMSRRPGIGKGFVEKYVDQFYPRDEVVVRGKTAQPPKYYDQYFEELEPDLMAEVKRKRREQMYKRASDNTPERLAVKRAHLINKGRLYARNVGA